MRKRTRPPMASEADVKSFIEQQREAGAFDSSGHFSVDMRKAREKSQMLHQQASAAHALLWVQACSHYKPISVRLNYTSVRMNGDVNLSWEKFQRIVFGQGTLEPHHKVMHKAILACAALAEENAWAVYSHHQHGRYQIHLSTGAITPMPVSEIGRLSQLDKEFVGVDFPRQGTAAQRAEELRQLVGRCGFSPCMPRYESRDLTEENLDGYLGRPPCTALWNSYTHPSYLLALRQMEKNPARTGFLVADQGMFKNQIPDRHENHSVFLLQRDRECFSGRADRVLAIPLGLEGAGFVRLISQGVLLESFDHDLGAPGAWAQVCVDHMETDLSGLKLVRNQQFEQMMSELKSQILELAGAALEQLDQFKLPRALEAPKPGLLVRALLWAFAPKEQDDPNKDWGVNSQDCRAEIRRRLS